MQVLLLLLSVQYVRHLLRRGQLHREWYSGLLQPAALSVVSRGFAWTAVSLVNRLVSFMGLDSTPDFKEVNKDIKDLSPRFTAEYKAKKKEVAQKLKSQKKMSPTPIVEASSSSGARDEL